MEKDCFEVASEFGVTPGRRVDHVPGAEAQMFEDDVAAGTDGKDDDAHFGPVVVDGPDQFGRVLGVDVGTDDDHEGIGGTDGRGGVGRTHPLGAPHPPDLLLFVHDPGESLFDHLVFTDERQATHGADTSS